MPARNSISRYRIKLPTEVAFRAAAALLEGAVPIFVQSEKRRMLSTGEIPGELETALAALGAQVSLDYQYTLEAPALEEVTR